MRLLANNYLIYFNSNTYLHINRLIIRYRTIGGNLSMKEATIICRLTSKEKQQLILKAKEENVTVSQLIRSKINSDILSDNVSRENSFRRSRELCMLMTEIQRLKREYPEIDIEQIEREAARLWQ